MSSRVHEIALWAAGAGLWVQLLGPEGCERGEIPCTIRLLRFRPGCGRTQLGQRGSARGCAVCTASALAYWPGTSRLKLLVGSPPWPCPRAPSLFPVSACELRSCSAPPPLCSPTRPHHLSSPCAVLELATSILRVARTHRTRARPRPHHQPTVHASSTQHAPRMVSFRSNTWAACP
jgi:hypothetical protein